MDAPIRRAETSGSACLWAVTSFGQIWVPSFSVPDLQSLPSSGVTPIKPGYQLWCDTYYSVLFPWFPGVKIGGLHVLCLDRACILILTWHLMDFPKCPGFLDGLNITLNTTESAPMGPLSRECPLSVSPKGKVKARILSLSPESIMTVITANDILGQSQPLHFFAPWLPHIPTEMSFQDQWFGSQEAGGNKRLKYLLLSPYIGFRSG